VPVAELVLGQKSGHRVSVCTTVLLVSGQSTSLYSLSSNFRMAFDMAKWSNYVHSYKSGTQGTPFCAGTQALPGSRAPSVDSPHIVSEMQLILTTSEFLKTLIHS